VARQSRTLLGVAPGPERAEVKGAPVGGVQPNSAAAAAGLRPGDLVTAIDGAPIESWQNLVRVISARKPGDKVKLSVERKGQTMEVEATLGQSDD
jgi:S1-C subfamily serine protease